MAVGALPTGDAIRSNVLGNLISRGGVTQSMLPVSITFAPTVVIAAGRLRTLENDISSFHEPLLRSVREVMVPSIKRNFDDGGRPAWEPLSESTLEIRNNMGFSGSQILVRSGALRRVASQINIWTITQASAMVMDFPEKVWYGQLHQGGFGGSGGGGKAFSGGKYSKGLRAAEKSALKSMRTAASAPYPVRGIPARPFIVLQPEDEAAIEEVFVQWMGERARRAWP